MQRELTVGSVSWIESTPNPIWLAAKAKFLEPAWVPKTYVGLIATANPTPPPTIADFPTFQRGKEFRALTYCRIRVDIDDARQTIAGLKVLQAVHDPGWTPPFRLRRYPSIGVLGFLDGWNAFKQAWSFQYYQGESSPLSLVATQALHKNTSISAIPPEETVLVNSLVKFRAGAHTDKIGIETVGAPYHVPWVWCETALTFVGGQFKFYGRGSIFPSHAWYLDGQRITFVQQVGDSSFPSTQVPLIGPPPGLPAPYFGPRLSVPDVFSIDVPGLVLYPVLSKGASAVGPQVPVDADRGLLTPVDEHPYTAPAGRLVVSS